MTVEEFGGGKAEAGAAAGDDEGAVWDLHAGLMGAGGIGRVEEWMDIVPAEASSAHVQPARRGPLSKALRSRLSL